MTEFTYTINAKFKYELNVYRADNLPDALYLFRLLQGVGVEWVNVYILDEKIEDYQRPPARAITPARQCATCSKPLHSVDTGDKCPACVHERNKSIAPF